MMNGVEVEKSLNEALLKLCNDKPLASISVSELVKEAKISRATFYLHHPNLNSLVKKIENDIIEQYENISSAQTYKDEIDKFLWYKSNIKPLFCKTKENLPWIRTLCSSVGDPTFYYKIRQFARIDNKKKHDQARLNCNPISFEYYIAACEGMFFHWVQTNAKIDIDDFTNQICFPLQSIIGR